MKYRIEMPDGAIYSVPLEVIAKNRADCYEDETLEDVMEFFKDDHFEAEDWAKNIMNWSDVFEDAVLESHPVIDFQEGWINGVAEIVD